MTLEEEITLLTDKWVFYVARDHHKDRDCHWVIEKRWSYGRDPIWIPWHNGYIADNWIGPECDTELMAQTLLKDKLKKELYDAIKHCKDIIALDDENGWGMPKEEAQIVLDYIGDIDGNS